VTDMTDEDLQDWYDYGLGGEDESQNNGSSGEPQQDDEK